VDTGGKPYCGVRTTSGDAADGLHVCALLVGENCRRFFEVKMLALRSAGGSAGARPVRLGGYILYQIPRSGGIKMHRLTCFSCGFHQY